MANFKDKYRMKNTTKKKDDFAKSKVKVYFSLPTFKIISFQSLTIYEI
jgi:hypothetical protein